MSGEDEEIPGMSEEISPDSDG